MGTTVNNADRSTDRVSMVLKIQDGFGLAMADLSDILRVPRNEFVAWLNNRLPDATDQRVERLAFWASWWHCRMRRGIAEFVRDTIRGRNLTLIDLLRADPLDERTLGSSLAELSLRMGGATPGPRQTVVPLVSSSATPPAPASSNVVDLRPRPWPHAGGAKA